MSDTLDSQAKQVLEPLTSPEEVDEFLKKYPTAAVFKAGTCHKTMQGFGVVETFLQNYDLPIGFIRVVDWRPASNHITELTNITHHSPQFILFKGGVAQFEVNNWSITPEALEPVFQEKVPQRSEAAKAGTSNDLLPYITLMQDYISGKLSDFEFQDKYVVMFRLDASLRTQKEFELLSRLFGDPDAYHGGLHQIGQPQARGDLKERVASLLRELE